MYFISITRLRLRSVVYLPAFIWHTFTSIRQLQKHSNFIKGKTLLDKHLTFWTMTSWKNEKDMIAYRNTAAHKRAMPKLQHWCDEASIVHWQQEAEELPDWIEAYQRMLKEGRVSKVKHPSTGHTAMQIAPPRYPSKTERVLHRKDQ